jgi:hypothetical protein
VERGLDASASGEQHVHEVQVGRQRVTERSPALLGLVSQQEVGQDEPSNGGGEEKDGDDTDGAWDPHDDQSATAGEVGHEEPGDGAEELVEGVPFRCASDQLELLVMAVGVVAERLDDPPPCDPIRSMVGLRLGRRRWRARAGQVRRGPRRSGWAGGRAHAR